MFYGVKKSFLFSTFKAILGKESIMETISAPYNTQVPNFKDQGRMAEQGSYLSVFIRKMTKNN